jgi:segregation and condensation protein B
MSGGDDDDGVLAFPTSAPVVGEEVVAAVEAMLFATGEPLAVAAAAAALEVPDPEIRAALTVLEGRRRGGGVVLERVAGGWQLRTAPRFASVLHRLLGTRPQKLSRPALEVLAIVAYQQPTSRTRIEEVRGVDSGGVLKSLLDRGLLRTAGRSSDPGRPLLYATTAAFLELFGLPDLAALPTAAERAALVRDQSVHERLTDDDELPPEPSPDVAEAEEPELPPEPEPPEPELPPEPEPPGGAPEPG